MSDPVVEQLSLLASHEADFVELLPNVSSHSPNEVAEHADDGARLHRIFDYEGDKLRLKDPRIKANTKIEFVGRLTCLFLHAHQLEGRPKVPRAALNAILTELEVYDGNARHWIATTSDLMADEETIWLSVPGTERAVDTLDRIDDPSISGSFVLGSSTRSRTAKPDVGTAAQVDGSAKPGKRRTTAVESKKITPWVERWKAAEISVVSYETMQSWTSAEKGLFGLWAIRKALGDEGKVVSRVQLAQFLYQAFEIKVNDATLAEALKTQRMKDKALNVEGTRFQITPLGMAHVDQMASLPPELSTVDATSSNGSFRSPK